MLNYNSDLNVALHIENRNSDRVGSHALLKRE